MSVVVVGGHSRNVGKTSVMAGLIAAMPERRWTAVKITQYGHGVCSANGEACDCETADHALAVTEEHNAESGTDTARYLGAGAARSLWVRTRQGSLVEAMPRLRKEMAASENIILESNSVLRFLQPDVYISVLNAENADFKESAKRYLDRADAVVLSGSLAAREVWQGVSSALLRRAVVFAAAPEVYCSPELVAFTRAHMASRI